MPNNLNRVELWLGFQKFIIKDSWGYAITISFFILFGWLTGKWFEGSMFVVAHCLIRPHFIYQLHSKNSGICISISVGVLLFGFAAVLPLYLSLLSCIPITYFVCWLGHLVAKNRILENTINLLRPQRRDGLRTYRSRRAIIKQVLGDVTTATISKRCEARGVDKTWQAVLIRLYVTRDKLNVVAADSLYTLEHFNTLLDAEIDKLI